MSDPVLSAVEQWFIDVRQVYSLGAGTGELSYYPALSALLGAVGQSLKPKVVCLSNLGDAGADHPDFGLYAASQVQKGEPRKGQSPERGVVEVKGLAEDVDVTAASPQVAKYLAAYGLVLVTNLREWRIVGRSATGAAVTLERFSLATTPQAFWALAGKPKAAAGAQGAAFAEFLRRALLQSVALREPKDVAWFLASYARDALARVEAKGDLAALASVREALEASLGVVFDAEKGQRFFRSTLVQTLFYGVFSAWVLWARDPHRDPGPFDWRLTSWRLRVPFVRTLFEQIASPQQLQPLGLVEVLDWTAAVLNRVEADAFFTRFNDADAVQFFYEPFLQAFDPALRRELGVWYTPREVVDYMVARVDRALRDDLGIADGLASDQVIVLDPCCGTGAYLSSVLRRIDQTLAGKGLGALQGQALKQAALERVFGFEIMPAPFVVAHLQVGLALQGMGAGLAAEGERAGVYLTNALTGWEPAPNKPLPYHELEEERDAADAIKRERKILVILGNPPYNGFAGMAVEEERALSTAYRAVKKVRKPEGQGLNDLYVRFFRMAERRIEKTGQGVIGFISNYSWLDGLSFTGMRERFLEAFDVIAVDRLNGDAYKTGKKTPEGLPDPSIFSTEHNRAGIAVGTAIVTLVRKAQHTPTEKIGFRDLWGTAKREQLTESAQAEPGALYTAIEPPLDLGLPFAAASVSAGYLDWPKLPELSPNFFAGVQTKRDAFLVDTEKETLEKRVEDFFNSEILDQEIASKYPSVWSKTKRYEPAAIRKILVARGAVEENIVRHAYRPYDTRWIYWEPETKLLGEKSPDYWPHAWHGNLSIATQKKPRGEWRPPQLVRSIASLDLIDRGASIFPLEIKDAATHLPRTNLGRSASDFLSSRNLPLDSLFYHILGVLHAPSYRADNAGALQMHWPRVPVPNEGETLLRSAALGRTLASFLDPEQAAPGVTTGALRPGLLSLGVASRVGEGQLTADDLALTKGWGYRQASDTGTIIMPGNGSVDVRDHTPEEREALRAEGAAAVSEAHPDGLDLDTLLGLLGGRTVDVRLNDGALWRNVPEAVWSYTLGGYQVIKKWLSYREQAVLGRALRLDEALYVSQMVRRIAAILMLGPDLDLSYAAAKADAVPWKDGRPAPEAASVQTTDA